MRQSIRVSTNPAYEILIQAGGLQEIGDQLKKIGCSGKIMVVTDDIVFGLHGDNLLSLLKEAGYQTELFVLPNGESSKNLQMLEQLLNQLASHQFTRSDWILAFGGGVTGDLAGFAASIYLRGIKYLQVPTTLLAAVDSSVGGKTAVNLEAGKNLAGCFWQPSFVLCDPNLLQTLPEEIMADGFAEVIKYAMIADLQLLEALESKTCELEEIIATCVRIKAEIVSQDERDNGLRKLLNFGHTFGHAVEAASSLSISHGKGVAIGMMMATKYALSLNMVESSLVDRLSCLLSEYHLPTCSPFSPKELFTAATHDKKRSQDKLDLVLPDKPGRCILKQIGLTELNNALCEGCK